MKIYKLLILFALTTIYSFGQSQIEFCNSFTNTARANSPNIKNSYFTCKDNTFIQVMYISELALDSKQNYITLRNESKDPEYLETLTKTTLKNYKEYGLTNNLKTYGFTKFQMILISNDNENLYSNKYSVDTLKKISVSNAKNILLDNNTIQSPTNTSKKSNLSNNYEELINNSIKLFEKYIAFKLLLWKGNEGYASEYSEGRNIKIGDINFDGNPDVIIIYTIEGDSGGGNNWYRNIFLLTVYNNEINDYKDCNVYGKNGNRNSDFLEIKNGYAIFNLSGYDKPHKIGIGIRNGNLVKEKILSE